jgi:hypothetical protein
MNQKLFLCLVFAFAFGPGSCVAWRPQALMETFSGVFKPMAGSSQAVAAVGEEVAVRRLVKKAKSKVDI